LGSNNRPQWLLISADVELLYTCMKIDHIFDFIKKIFAEFPDLKGRWKLDSLRNVGRTDGHKGDFILCPMLCIALDRQKTLPVKCDTAAERVARMFSHENKQMCKKNVVNLESDSKWCRLISPYRISPNGNKSCYLLISFTRHDITHDATT